MLSAGNFPVTGYELKCGILLSVEDFFFFFLTPFSHQKVGGEQGKKYYDEGEKSTTQRSFLVPIRQPLTDWSSLNSTLVSTQVFIEKCRKFEFKVLGRRNARLHLQC